ncbi:KilA-N domain-containing protein [Mycoplasmopsis gallopavonis]|nr:KilA-N domain-containing protein [Mycoplasmopsis gallopavonis]
MLNFNHVFSQLIRSKNKKTIEAKEFKIEIYTEDFKNDYISLTDIARYKNQEEPNVVVANWIRNFNTIEYLRIREKLNNPKFNPLEFEGVSEEAGSNAFTLSPQKWVTTTNAKGLFVKVGRGGGTFAHKDIAFKFASWLSAEFELYIIKDYQRLKQN